MADKIDLLVDVDNTVANTGKAQWAWLCEQLVTNIDMPKMVCNYDLTNYFFKSDTEEGSKVNRKECMYFFDRDNEPYNKVEPYEGAQEALKKLHDNGFNIIFVSHIVGDHFENKLEWVEKHFPFLRGFIGTKQKHLIKGDAIIDDRHDRLNKVDCKFKVKHDTIYTQEEPLELSSSLLGPQDILISSNWEEIAEYLLTVKPKILETKNV